MIEVLQKYNLELFENSINQLDQSNIQNNGSAIGTFIQFQIGNVHMKFVIIDGNFISENHIKNNPTHTFEFFVENNLSILHKIYLFLGENS